MDTLKNKYHKLMVQFYRKRKRKLEDYIETTEFPIELAIGLHTHCFYWERYHSNKVVSN